MIYSMTAFARTDLSTEQGNFLCEMRSVNHRYLDLSLNLPDTLRVFEMPLRDRIREEVKRGKVECFIRYQPKIHDQAALSLNAPLVAAIVQAMTTISESLTESAPVSPLEVLRFPEVLETKKTDPHVLFPIVTQLLEKTLQDLIKHRAREGEELKKLFLERLKIMDTILAAVKKRLPIILTAQRDKLLKRFADLKLDIDPLRLEQELVITAQKMDVAEEIDRTETHVTEVRRVLAEGGLVGRRLDFLLQELHREANTLGSKSLDPDLSHAAIEMKVMIEQVREQVQNIE